ncbi:MAG: septum formation inhibitor [Ruminococcus sp.]|nr:septum formation inhibitor [Ruminococcus sp.]
MAKNHNLAYALREEEQEELQAQRNIKHKVNALSLPDRRTLAFSIIGIIIVLALMAGMIFGKVEISSLYAQRAELEAQLTQLQSENVSLQSELAEKTNMTKVEEYAENNLGLQKLDKTQIEYVEVEKQSVAEIKNDDDSSIFVKIKRWFTSAMEYIGL